MREISDAVRDLAAAMAAGALARESQRQEGQARGETVVAQVGAFHSSILATIGELVRRIDALETAKRGAPYMLVYILIGAAVVQSGVVLHLYGQSRGHDASAAFRDVSEAAQTLAPVAPKAEP